MRGVLISIDAWDRVAAAVVTVRIGAALNASTLGADGYAWEPVLSRRPRLSQQLADDDLNGQLKAGEGEFGFNAAKLKNIANPLQMDWVGSPVRVYSGDSDKLADMTLEFVGRITSGVPNADTGIVPISMQVDKAIVDVPLLINSYTGGGGAEGDVEIRGLTKPAGFGKPVNVKPILIDAVNNVYQVDAYGNLTGFAGLYEDLADYGASKGNYATYAALVAAAIAEGEWGTCFAQGMFRLGAPAAGTITCDPICGYGTPGDMMQRWLLTHAQVPAIRVRSADFDALTAAVAAAVGESPTCSFWTTDTGNVLNLMQRMCQSCNAVPLFLFDGTISVSRCIGGDELLTLDRQGGDPPVTAWSTNDPPVPWWRMKMAAARAYYVNPPAEIDYEDDIRDMGDYDAAETYRQGMVVRGDVDARRYIYTYYKPTSGHGPPNPAYWDVYEEAPDATMIRYTSGYTLQSREPQEAGANVTEIRVAAAITGQGAFATQSSAAYGSQITGLPAAIAPANILTGGVIDAGQVRYGSGGPLVVSLQPAESGANVTATHTAAAITGQAATATSSDYAVVTGVTRPSDYAGTSGLLVTIGSYTTIVGNSVAKLAGTHGGNEGGAVGLPLANTAFVATSLLNVASGGSYQSAIALDDDATTYAFGSMNYYARYIATGAGAGTVQLYTTGSVQVGANTNVTGLTTASRMRLIYDGNKVWVDIDGTVIGTKATAASGQRLYPKVLPIFDANNLPAGQRYQTDILFGPYSDNSWASTSGSPNAPADNADVTATHTAAAISGQADWATYTGLSTTNVAGRVTYLDTSGNLSSIQRITDRRMTYLYRADGTTALTEAAAITSQGTAAAIAGQGAFATVNTAAYGSGLLTGFGAMAARARVALNDGYTFRADGTTALTDALAVTSLGTAAGIAGQGAFATVNTAAYGSGLLTGFAALAARASVRLGDGYVFRNDGTTSLTDALAVTSLGTAAAISGQGALATINSAAWGSQVSGRPTELTDGRVSTALTAAGLVQTRVPSTLLGNASASNIESDPYFVDTAAWSLWGSQTTFSTTAAALTAIGTPKVIKGAIGASNPLGADGPARDVPPGGTFFGTMKIYVEAGFIGAPQFFVKFLDRTGAQLDLTYITFSTFGSTAAAAAGVYDIATPTKAAPAGTVKVSVSLYCGNISGGACYFGLPKIAQSITPGQAALGDTTNIVPDPDFIDPVSTWAMPAGWSAVANATAGEGAGKNKLVIPSSAGFSGAATKSIAIPPSCSIIAGIYVKRQSGTTGDLLVTAQFYDAAGGFISYANYTTYLTTGNAVGRFNQPSLSPANTASVKYSILSYGNGNTTWEVSEPIIRVAPRIGANLLRADGTTATTDAGIYTPLGTAAGFSGQGTLATQNAVTWQTQFSGAPAYVTDPYTSGGVNYLQAGYVFRANADTRSLYDYFPATTNSDRTSAATAAGITGQGSLATLNSVNMDTYVVDGSTYARPRAAELSSGYLRLGIAGSGAQVGDQRNLPPINATNLNSRFTGQTITYSAAAGSPATATISVSAFTALLGSVSVSYNATSVGVTGTNGSTVNYLLYFDDATYAGGTRTLVATTNGDTLLSNNSRVFVGAVAVTYPSSGTGGGGGSGGGGGGCVDEDSWISGRAGLIRGAYVADDELIECATEDMRVDRTEYRPVQLMGPRIPRQCFRLHTDLGPVVASACTPMTLRDLSIVMVPDMLGHDVLVKQFAGGAWRQSWQRVIAVEDVGVRWVVQIGVNDGMYFAGETPTLLIATHNIYNKDF